MISDHELVLAAAATYDPKASPFFQAADGALRVFLTRSAAGDLTIISVEGTHDPLGWAFDFVAIPEETRPTVDHPTLEWVHEGFFLLAALMMPSAREIARRGPYAICGHSLGAALAVLSGAMLVLEGLPPVKIGAFAVPRVGGDRLVSVATSVPLSAFRYADDPVPMVPFTLRRFPYRQVPLEQIGRASFARAIVDPFFYHHVAGYVADVPQEDYPCVPQSR